MNVNRESLNPFFIFFSDSVSSVDALLIFSKMENYSQY